VPNAALPTMQRTLMERLICLHDEIKGEGELAAINRIAVAVYDSTTDVLKTFIQSSDGDSPLDHTAARLSELPTLQRLAWTGARRTINDLEAVARTGAPFAGKLVGGGYLSSHTVPIQYKGIFYGFLFFNSFRRDGFGAATIGRLRPHADVIALTVMREMDTVRMMRASIQVIRRVSSARDEETAHHLARMSHYARLIAHGLAPRRGLSDEFVEFVFQFCPLHDVGKVGVPDHILLKPGRLSPDEFEIMKTHVARGVEIVDLMVRDFGLSAIPHFDLLRNIVAFHHESLDGSGYPYRLEGGGIPLESRIAAVADVFDALTSARPYKSAWSNEQALDLLRDGAGRKFDPECVGIMLDNMPAILDIQSRFNES
jgi:HD-GYP domain-containing protein (c-di-GMP phosphodiesterase class II)